VEGIHAGNDSSFSQIAGHMEALGTRKARSSKHWAQRKNLATKKPKSSAMATPAYMKPRIKRLALRDSCAAAELGLRIDSDIRVRSFRPVAVEGEAGED
jgi:hypothetical protein